MESDCQPKYSHCCMFDDTPYRKSQEILLSKNHIEWNLLCGSNKNSFDKN